jgi:hypothetical protein
MTLAKIKQHLRNGQYAWPGGYPLYFTTNDGAALSFKAVREEWRSVVEAHILDAKYLNMRSSWLLAGVEINYEDNELYCDHTGERIESAYGEE